MVPVPAPSVAVTVHELFPPPFARNDVIVPDASPVVAKEKFAAVSPVNCVASRGSLVFSVIDQRAVPLGGRGSESKRVIGLKAARRRISQPKLSTGPPALVVTVPEGLL